MLKNTKTILFPNKFIYLKKPLVCIIITVLNINVLFSQDVYIQQGDASFYADKFEGRLTASGEKYWHYLMTASHLTLPFNSRIKVTNLINNKSVVVKINDRGPFVQGRIIDLSKSAAQKLDFIESGTVKVKIELLKDSSSTNIDNQQSLPDGEFYQTKSNKIKPKGFGIQIGSFAEMTNLLRLTENIQKTFKEETIVQVTKVNNVRVYRVFIGVYANRNDADKMKIKLQNSYPDSFVISYENLK